jgi:DNA mismatch endonuclease (patch repair protein)
MRANRRRDTTPELALRSALHRTGARYRVDYPVRLPNSRPIRPDIVFTARRVAVFVDGCFWHGCPIHGTTPATNRDYWQSKLTTNRERDLRTTAPSKRAGLFSASGSTMSQTSPFVRSSRRSQVALLGSE